MSQRKTPTVPHWYKNTYFWIAGVLFVVGVIGLLLGDDVIRDPGQKVEHHLYLLYFVATAVMVGNGWISHRQTVQQYEEAKEAER